MSKNTKRDSICNYVATNKPEGFTLVPDADEQFTVLEVVRDILARAAVDYRRAKKFCAAFNRLNTYSALAECSINHMTTRIVICFTPV
jgi:hypothetical protein